MPVSARRFLRKMRGGAQAHLLEAEDDKFYIVKFTNNPQSRRILINEWIASAILKYLEIAHPDVALIDISSDFIAQFPDVHFQLGASRKAVEPGWHFGSAFPGDPAKQAVYDFLPDVLLAKVANKQQFLGALAFDKWTGNSDSRQSIFFRARIENWYPTPGGPEDRVGFIAQMIDHGYIFDGPHWSFTDSPLSGLYMRTGIYQDVRGFDSFEPWLSRIQHFPEEVIDKALREIPQQWLQNEDSGELEKMMDRLLRRRKRVPDLIRDLKGGRTDPFPNWQ